LTWELAISLGQDWLGEEIRSSAKQVLPQVNINCIFHEFGFIITLGTNPNHMGANI
jgi:hypothetical protein